MALPIIAGLTGTTALAAYLNAKHHILHDIRNGKGGMTPDDAVFNYIASRAEQKRLLIYHTLQDHAEKQPNHPFLIFEGKTWTYKEFLDRVVRTANWLMKDLGIEVGELVSLDGGNSPEYLALWFALDGIGAVTVFLNWNLTGQGLEHCIKLAESRYILADTDVRHLVEPSRSTFENLGMIIQYYDPDLISSHSDSTPIPPSRWDTITPDTLRGLMYTSGTTGLPKAIVFTTGREVLTGFMTARYLKLTPADRMYTCMPLYHGAGHHLCTTPMLLAGGTVVLGRRFSHKTFWPEVAESKATILQYVGELGRYLLNGPPNEYERKHCVQRAWGNGMRPDVWEPFRQRFNIPIINELYAATDGLGAMFNRNEGEFTAGSIGLRGAIWNWRYGNEEVRVKMDVDTEDIMRDKNGFAIRCGVNEPGQVLHRLDRELLDTTPTYYKNEAATVNRRIEDVFEKGDLWFKSGDMMRVDSDGRVYFADRLGDTFRWKSENVSTNEVSDVLGKFPQIAESNAYGVLVPGYDGRAGAATVVMKNGVTEAQFDFAALARHVKERLPGYAVPLFLRFSPQLDYTGTMKLQKGKLKREGVDPDLVTGSDTIYWLPSGSDRYVPFERKDWEGIKEKKVRLT